MHALLAIVTDMGQNSVRNRLQIRNQPSFGLILEILYFLSAMLDSSVSPLL